jgi:hypothetical protein
MIYYFSLGPHLKDSATSNSATGRTKPLARGPLVDSELHKMQFIEGNIYTHILELGAGGRRLYARLDKGELW